MTDTPPDAFAMSGAEAGAALAKMTAEFRGAPPSDKPTTPAKAQSRLNQLTADKAWADRLAKGDVAARREFTELTAQVANSAGPLGGTELEVVDSISDPNRMPKERYDGLLEGLREQGCQKAARNTFATSIAVSALIARPPATGQPVSSRLIASHATQNGRARCSPTTQPPTHCGPGSAPRSRSRATMASQ